ncbi:ribonuclease E/G [uncultured Litoreibacter sp.]|uniref:ribonuclease E/G n=1 Tax=uncultured Litoreibacter sp. TaxID=1392394 RepID=UPI0026248B98|nr:ribonuclease E/G [uncultured Litoreibacter sp.]
MAKKMLIDATHAEETRVVVADGNKVDEFDFESENKRQLAGNIYLAKVTRVEPSLQAAFVDYGGNRHGFLAYSEIHPDYYQIPMADRQALIEEELEYARMQAEEDEKPKKSRSRSRGRSRSQKAKNNDAVVTEEVKEPAEDAAAVDVNADGGELSGEAPAVDTPAVEAEAVAEAVTEVAVEADTPAEAPVAVEAAPEAEAAPAISGMDVVDLDEGDDTDSDDEEEEASASEKDENIESVAQEDVTEEIRQPRKPRAKRYKIQEVIKVRQILLVQVVKEERGNKGAALTTYLSLAGRYCVLMPNTARGGGISRKITNPADRKKLKEIANEIDVPLGAGLIVRTAGSQRTKTEIKRDYEYLQRQWEQVRELTLKSIAPAQIYEEGDLIKRSIRDLYNKDIDEVIIEGEAGYRVAKDFMRMIMPSHAKNVKRYTDSMPLFARHQVESYLSGMFNPTVQLPSGGYIVIDTTEALVAVDVNSGRATKEGSIEQTALKTNLEAAAEVARQARLRDLAGLIVIDFIDMDERRNNTAVEKLLKDKLKTDRARIQVGRISGFGLLEMSRQRLRPGMLEATTQPCPSCHGTGLIRSDDSLALTILRQLEEEGTRKRSREVLLKAPIAVINYLMNEKREHVAQIESRYNMAVRLEADAHLVSPDYSIEKFKTATRVINPVASNVVSMDSIDMSDIDEMDNAIDEALAEEEAKVEAPEQELDENGNPKKKKRRRRRGGRGRSKSAAQRAEEGATEEGVAASEGDPKADDAKPAEPSTDGEVSPEAAPEAEEKPKSRSRSRSRSRSKTKTDEAVAADAPAVDAVAEAPVAEAAAVAAAVPEAAEAKAEEKPKKPRTRSRSKKVVEAEAEADAAAADTTAPETAADTVEEKPKKTRSRKAATPKAAAKSDSPAKAPSKRAKTAKAKKSEEVAAPEPAPEPAAETVATAAPVEVVAETEAAPAPKPKRTRTRVSKPLVAEAATEEPAAAEVEKPKRKGWWSLGR